MTINSRAKGKNGELELVDELKQRGFYSARRGQQYSGGAGSADVVSSLPGIHLECKRVEKGSLHEWLAQAVRDAGGAAIPVVAHRRNRGEWVAVLRLADLVKILAR